jgi:hypothetical protein
MQPIPPASPKHSIRRPLLIVLSIGLLTGVAYGVFVELQTSWPQAFVFARVAGELTFKLGTGPTVDIRFPPGGPYDHQLGYQQLPGLVNDWRAMDSR